ncbi:dGTPase [Marinobacter fonticola]|uniref:dGTPase n=1 Tax=Marinobacter fonticola TaxID=2603215 RepID=UPI0011E7D002|nr:dGTPase [Marinobacter fonticola]
MGSNPKIDFSTRFSIQRPYNRRADGDDIDQFRVETCGLQKLEDQLESDRGRIIGSAAVRRLQQKTQVFPLERNAAVRSRLTHSLEVQQTGRFIVRTIFRKLGDRAGDYGLTGLERATETLVEMACLMHDIGNPPFGHFGEAALSRWFEENLRELTPFREVDAGSLTDRLMLELQSFEGNAQAIRLISQLQKLNLTYVQAASVFKYTRPATEAKPKAGTALAYLRKKPGYYYSENAFVEGMQQALGMEPGHRHPLAYVMEAADDISYCLADLEDSVDKGLMTYPVLAELLIKAFDEPQPGGSDESHIKGRSFRSIIEYASSRAGKEPINRDHEFFVWLRVGLIHPLVEHAAQAFIDNIEEVYHGRLDRALLEDNSPCHAVIEAFKRVAMAHVFSVPEVETLELQGYRIISSLLEHYKPLLALSSIEFSRLVDNQTKGLLIESRLFKRLPNKHVKAYLTLRDQRPPERIEEEVWERYCRCRLIQDMVSGMTDQFALDEFHTLSVMDRI